MEDILNIYFKKCERFYSALIFNVQ